MATNVTFELRRGTSSAWVNANTLLAAGEPGVETDTGNMKVGDGVRRWNTLPYFTPTSYPNNTIVLNASGTPFAGPTGVTGGFFVSPIRSIPNTGNPLFLTSNNEIVVGTSSGTSSGTTGGSVGPQGPQGPTGPTGQFLQNIVGSTGINVDSSGPTMTISSNLGGSNGIRVFQKDATTTSLELNILGSTGININRGGDTMTISSNLGGSNGIRVFQKDATTASLELNILGSTGININRGGDTMTISSNIIGSTGISVDQSDPTKFLLSANISGGTGINVGSSGPTITISSNLGGSNGIRVFQKDATTTSLELNILGSAGININRGGDTMTISSNLGGSNGIRVFQKDATTTSLELNILGSTGININRGGDTMTISSNIIGSTGLFVESSPLGSISIARYLDPFITPVFNDPVNIALADNVGYSGFSHIAPGGTGNRTFGSTLGINLYPNKIYTISGQAMLQPGQATRSGGGGLQHFLFATTDEDPVFIDDTGATLSFFSTPNRGFSLYQEITSNGSFIGAVPTQGQFNRRSIPFSYTFITTSIHTKLRFFSHVRDFADSANDGLCSVFFSELSVIIHSYGGID